ncbi:GTPase Era [Alicyclobacillus contaminans]|uniref:GTPase Era n=1 Tax=Alicyclobacillus contaminans TaxID=392016 RepID=UPI00047AB1F7|nr:GTPase Era [Alicyclobacillus contaminans]GMA52162.1 GTPase Era [Alicyclobacillus contaminans]
MTKTSEAQYRSGFAALVGRPNVGKSTLLNALVGQKVAIMSNRPQTTRNRIRGVLTTPEMQIVFIDTPGIHKPHHRLGEYMVEAAEATFREVDVILFVCDVTQPNHPGDDHVLEKLKNVQTPVFLVLNKVDAVEKPKILEMIATYRDKHSFAEIIPVSAKHQEQLDVLTAALARVLPEGPQFYPADMVTDHPEQFIISEIIREKVLHLTREEVPHSVAVGIEQLERREASDVLYIHAVIYTERDSQKGILIGKRGAMLRKVGQLARQELEALFGNKVYLELWVKVKKDWRNEPSMLRRFGFDDV